MEYLTFSKGKKYAGLKKIITSVDAMENKKVYLTFQEIMRICWQPVKISISAQQTNV